MFGNVLREEIDSPFTLAGNVHFCGHGGELNDLFVTVPCIQPQKCQSVQFTAAWSLTSLVRDFCDLDISSNYARGLACKGEVVKLQWMVNLHVEFFIRNSSSASTGSSDSWARARTQSASGSLIIVAVIAADIACALGASTLCFFGSLHFLDFIVQFSLHDVSIRCKLETARRVVGWVLTQITQKITGTYHLSNKTKEEREISWNAEDQRYHFYLKLNCTIITSISGRIKGVTELKATNKFSK